MGTSSTKDVLARPDGGIVVTAQRDHGLSLPRPGWAEYDVGKVRWAVFVSGFKGLLDKADDRIAAVCTSGIGTALLPADENGSPLRPGLFRQAGAHPRSGQLTKQSGATRRASTWQS